MVYQQDLWRKLFLDLHKTSQDLQNLIRVRINLKEYVSCDLRIFTTFVHNVYDGELKPLDAVSNALSMSLKNAYFDE